MRLIVEGMRCQKNCARRIRAALMAVPGVEDAEVTFKDKQAIVKFVDGAFVPVVKLINAIQSLDAGAKKHFNAYLPTDKRSVRTVYLHVDGMSCAMNCAKKVELALQKADGVDSASVIFAQKLAVIAVQPDSRITEDHLVAVVEGIRGKRFTAYVVDANGDQEATRTSSIGPAMLSPSSLQSAPNTDIGEVMLTVVGMTCTSCANSVETALKQSDGVVSAIVNFATESAYVKFSKKTIGIRSLVDVVESIGYGASVAAGSTTVASHENRIIEIAAWKWRFYVSAFFTFPIVLIMIVLDNIAQIRSELQKPAFGIPGATWDSFVPLILATPVQFYAAFKFHKEAIKGVLNRVLGMSFLVSMGTNAAYFYGLFSDLRSIYWKNHSYSVPDMYMTSTMLITFIVLGKLLEAIAKGRTNDALRKLFELQAKVATLIVFNSDGSLMSEEVVPIELVQQGDILKVVRGASVPTDGIITFGEGRIDESMLTGESQPVKKQVGATVLGATVNVDGLFHMRVTGVGKDTALSQIVRLVEDAQTSKVPIQAYADKLASVFVPVVVGLSVLTFIVWYVLTSYEYVDAPADSSNFLFSFNFAISTLVVACPCALGLATPTAIMVGTGVGASHGILIKGGEPLEVAHKVNTVLFDKTGTLTEGTPTVTDVIVVNDDWDADTLMVLAGSAELGSEHLLGRAIVNHAKLLDKPLEQPQTFHAVSGKGISVELSNELVHLGNIEYMRDCGMKSDLSLVNQCVKLEQAGKTVIYMGICDAIVALIGISDAPRSEAKQTIAYLHSLGLDVYMVTGDNYRNAYCVAEQIGIPPHHIMAEVLPSSKVAKVTELQSQGRLVAMVGDGINDAPALAQANLGIAIGAGTDIAIEAASMVLMKSKLQDVVTALDLSKTIYRRIQMNFGWALGYNLILIPIAAGVFYVWDVVIPPMFAGAAMAFSSVSVVISSLLLKWYSPPDILRVATTEQEDFAYIEAASPLANSMEEAVDKALAVWKRATAPSKKSVRTQLDEDSVAKCRPNNWDDFLTRVRTFTSLNWFAKPRDLDLLVCAQHGWINTGPDELQCQCCHEKLHCFIDSRLSQEGAHKVAVALRERLTSYHLDTCPWKENPSPASFCNLRFWTIEEGSEAVLRSIASTCIEAADIDESCLVQLDQEFLEELFINIGIAKEEQAKFCDAVVNKATGISDKPNFSSITLVAMAVCGWKLKKHSDAGMIVQCDYCNRSVVATQKTHETLEESNTKRLKPNSFHPLEEHRWFCPWQRQVEEQPGWVQCANALKAPTTPSYKRSADTNMKATDVVSAVHSILDF